MPVDRGKAGECSDTASLSCIFSPRASLDGFVPQCPAETISHQTHGSIPHPASPNPDSTAQADLPALPQPAVTTVPRSTLDLARESTANADPHERSAGRDLRAAQPHSSLPGMGATPILCVPFCWDNVLQK